MLKDLKIRQQNNEPIRVGLVGAGSMGRAIAYQVSITPGMELAFIGDTNGQAAQKASELVTGSQKAPVIVEDTLEYMRSDKAQFDVLVEATNSIHQAYDYCVQALESGSHVVLMNAEVDLAYAYPLRKLAKEKGLVCTSDAGDQHGVLMRMIEEIQLWGFDITQAGNMKGFLNREATVESLQEEADKRKLSAVQCCAYTDGTKLNIEMALVANATGLLPTKTGMEGPRCERVEDVLDVFDFNKIPATGSVDYVLGATPGGGVYVVGKCAHAMQQFYLDYYKVSSRDEYHLFYRPYHLCHLETTRAIARAELWNKPMFELLDQPVTDVYAYAKRDLEEGEVFQHGLGDDLVYGQVQSIESAEKENLIPVIELAPNSEGTKSVLNQKIQKNQPINKKYIY